MANDPDSPRPSTARPPSTRKRATERSGVARRTSTDPRALLGAIGAIAAVAMIGMLIWNVNLRNDVSDLRGELETIRGENASLRENANATVYQLLPTEDAPQNAHAQAWFSIQGSGVLSVANMPQLEEGTTYQFWYVTDSPNAPIPGGTFSVDSNGQGFMLIPADVDGVKSIAVSIEPEGGSSAPTGTVLLSSDVSDARG
ncbi:MAG TPA: anti-sigma factor [Thermomicrobiales bacterium]|nr:anti-sigma factor [Thermomicrobiales bacterium]